MAITYNTGNITNTAAQSIVVEINPQAVIATDQEVNVKINDTANFKYYTGLRRNELLQYKNCYLYVGKKTYFNTVSYPNFWEPTNLADLGLSLDAIVTAIAGTAITSIAVPAMGMKHDNLDWITQVKPLIEMKLSAVFGLNIEIWN